MVRAWYMDNDISVDKRQPHMRTPPKFVDLQDLEKIGVLYHKMAFDDLYEREKLDRLKKERGYTYEDVITISRELLPNYDEKLKTFYKEHIHSDEEIRLVEDGSGYFDVRDSGDAWIRIEVTRGDLLILPAGIYHRFTLDGNNYIKARRYFVGEPVWTPFNRPADDHDARQTYLKTLLTV